MPNPIWYRAVTLAPPQSGNMISPAFSTGEDADAWVAATCPGIPYTVVETDVDCAGDLTGEAFSRWADWIAEVRAELVDVVRSGAKGDA